MAHPQDENLSSGDHTTVGGFETPTLPPLPGWRLIRRLWLLMMVLLIVPLAAISLQRSTTADWLGLWSTRRVGLLGMLCAAMLTAGSGLRLNWPRPRPFVERTLARVTRSTLLRGLLIALPLVGWGAMGVYCIRLNIFPTLGVLASFLVMLAVCGLWSLSVLAAGRTEREQRLLLLKVATSLAAVLLALGAAEFAGRKLLVSEYAHWDINPKSLEIEFATDDFRTRVVTNVQGLREPALVPADHPHEFRIVVLGDSMTFGWGVEYEEAYPQVFETARPRHPDGRSIQVVNLGKPGASPVDYLLFLQHYALRLKPDLVVVGFLVGNDCPIAAPPRVMDDAEVERRLATLAAQAERGPAPLAESFLAQTVARGIVRPLRQWSPAPKVGKRGPIFREGNPLETAALEAALALAMDPAAARARTERFREAGWIDKGLAWEWNPWLVRGLMLNPSGPADLAAARPESLEAMRAEWRVCAGLIGAMNVQAQQAGVPLHILAIPNAQLVSRRWLDVLQEMGCEVNDAMLTTDTVNRWLAETCQSEGIPLIDPLAEFRAAERAGEDLYFLRDDHMNSAGHRKLGRSLAAKLKLERLD